ncbi:MAG: CoA transferase [Dehalococcoidales bacterium]|nr:CoA transferase [Dehalococcoidales bacterium]
MSGILEGIKIIDMGHVAAVPAAGAMMADWGAEVIKVEPLTGERSRGTRVNQDGFDWGIQLLNRNKKGLALDLKKDAGKDILYRLIKKADIFMSNYELSALKSLKMDYATISRINPGIVYGVLTAYGTQGPDKSLRGFDYSAGWARSGIQYLLGEPGDPPPPQRGAMIDLATGTQIVAGLLAALLHKQKTGKGQEVQFSLYHSGVWTIAVDIEHLLLGQPVTKFERLKAITPLWNSFQAKDGRWFQLTLHIPDEMWPDVCKAIEKPELANDPRFTTKEQQELNREEMVRILDRAFATRDIAEWEKRFRENNLIYGRIQTPEEVVADPQALANDFFPEVKHPQAGLIKIVNTPVRFCQNPTSLKTPAPDCGQHTEEILREAGYSKDEINRFRNDGVLK